MLQMESNKLEDFGQTQWWSKRDLKRVKRARLILHIHVHMYMYNYPIEMVNYIIICLELHYSQIDTYWLRSVRRI